MKLKRVRPHKGIIQAGTLNRKYLVCIVGLDRLAHPRELMTEKEGPLAKCQVGKMEPRVALKG